MARHNLQSLCIALASLAILILLPLWSFIISPWPLQFSSFPNPNPKSDVVCQLQARGQARIGTGQESKHPTFYDDNTTLYTIDEPVVDWDQKRSRWFNLHPTFSPSENRVLVVTGSQPSSCMDPLGDHFLLRCFKNKVDYCRIHGYNIFYNNAFLHLSHWAEMPVIRAAMVAHPQVEWLLWVDFGAIFTDMDFEIPFERYRDHNLVVHGGPDRINTGVFLIRNCEWSMELLDVWGGMSPNHRKWGEILKSTFKEMIYMEDRHVLHGYWHNIVGRFDEFDSKYVELEKRVEALKRRHAEAVSEGYAAKRGSCAEEGGWRRPFVTDFTGCQPCSGEHNPAYVGDPCRVGMERALNFADNQVLKNYGFMHPDLGNVTLVTPLSSHYRRAQFDHLS